MQVPIHTKRVVRFEAFELDLSSGELHKHGIKVRLQEQPFQILTMLLDRPGEVVTREELRERLWPADTFVDFETGLNSAIQRLRSALGDSAEDSRYIETMPRRGYRFVAAVTSDDTTSAATPVRPTDAVVPAPVPMRRPITAIGGILLVLAVAGWFAWRWTTQGKRATAFKVTQFTMSPGWEDSPTWSPDGRSIAYVSDETGQLDIYMQQITGGRTIRLTDSDADDAQPAWSPDGSQIAFVSSRAYPEKRLSNLLNLNNLQSFFAGRNGDVWLMPALGGAARRIAEGAYYPSWSPDGKQLVYQAMRKGQWGLWVSDVEGTSKPRLLISKGPAVITQPAWSPDGRWIAYSAGVGSGIQVFVMPATGGEPGAATPEDSNALMPSWSPDGRWLYFSSDRSGAFSVWRARFDTSRLLDYEQVTSGTETSIHAHPDPTGKRLAFSSVRLALDLWQYDLATQEAARLTSETTQEDQGQPSPDGKWVALTSNRLGNSQIWLLSRQDGSLTQVSSRAQNVTSPRWSAGSKYLYFADEPPPNIVRFEISTGNATKVYEGQRPGTSFSVSPDDRFLVVPTTEGIVKVEVASGRKETLVRQEADATVIDPAVSPDGRWVAYYLARGNDRKIWMVPFPGGTPRQVTFGEGEHSHPSWSPDSRFVYFLRNHQDIYVVPREGGEPRPITNYHSFSTLLDYPSLTADGKKIIFTRIAKVGDIFLLENPQK